MASMNQETIEKLESIFTPYAERRRKDAIKNNTRFVHYTSAENALKIIQSKKLWMRNARCMNDYMEISHGHAFLVKFFNDANHRKLFFKTMEPFGKDIAQESLNLFDQWWRKIEFNTFISSISEHESSEDIHGRLSMWRAYGQIGAKAAIVVNIPFQPFEVSSNIAQKLHILLRPAAYFDYENIEKELLEVIYNLKKNYEFLAGQNSDTVKTYLFSMLIIFAISCKHKGFIEEKEWRIIHFPDLNPSDIIESSLEVIDGIPQNIYKIPLDDNPIHNITGLSIPQLVDRIIIGPSEFPLVLYEAFKIALENSGIENPSEKVIISDIPLRT